MFRYVYRQLLPAPGTMKQLQQVATTLLQKTQFSNIEEDSRSTLPFQRYFSTSQKLARQQQNLVGDW